jgi:hypothetical protein
MPDVKCTMLFMQSGIALRIRPRTLNVAKLNKMTLSKMALSSEWFFV